MISLVDGWGPDDPDVPLRFDEWKVSQFDSPIGLLLGGVGDGEYCYSATLSLVLSPCVHAFVTAGMVSPRSMLLASPFSFAWVLLPVVCLPHSANVTCRG